MLRLSFHMPCIVCSSTSKSLNKLNSHQVQFEICAPLSFVQTHLWKQAHAQTDTPQAKHGQYGKLWLDRIMHTSYIMQALTCKSIIWHVSTQEFFSGEYI